MATKILQLINSLQKALTHFAIICYVVTSCFIFVILVIGLCVIVWNAVSSRDMEPAPQLYHPFFPPQEHVDKFSLAKPEDKFSRATRVGKSSDATRKRPFFRREKNAPCSKCFIIVSNVISMVTFSENCA